MGFMWLDASADPRQAEYARAYDRAIRGGSIDSAISWELSGFKTKDGSVVTGAPLAAKESLRKDPHYEALIERVDIAVRALRQSRTMATMQHPHLSGMQPSL